MITNIIIQFQFYPNVFVHLNSKKRSILFWFLSSSNLKNYGDQTKACVGIHYDWSPPARSDRVSLLSSPYATKGAPAIPMTHVNGPEHCHLRQLANPTFSNAFFLLEEFWNHNDSLTFWFIESKRFQGNFGAFIVKILCEPQDVETTRRNQFW